MNYFVTLPFIQIIEILQQAFKANLRQGYALEWLDTLINRSLNPVKTDVSAVQRMNTAEIESRIEEEKQRLKTFIKNTVFSLDNERKISLFIKQYHSGLIQLLERAIENHKECPEKLAKLKSLSKALRACIEDLLCFIENRFYAYLEKAEAVTITHSSAAISEVKEWLSAPGLAFKNTADKRKMVIIMSRLRDFVWRTEEGHSVTCGEVAYIKELVHGLRQLDNREAEGSIFSSLDFLLISINFNSRAYRECLVRQLTERNNQYKDTTEKLPFLLLHAKILNQIPVKPGKALDPQELELKAVLNSWLDEEIRYLKKKTELLEENSCGGGKEIETGNPKNKIICRLSADQLGILLRATDELGILAAKSMNQMFKRIVPHLSTRCKKNLSYDSVRSKAYAAERRDKEIAIETLRRMIDKIKEY